jgi:hypothetical protein
MCNERVPSLLTMLYKPLSLVKPGEGYRQRERDVQEQARRLHPYRTDIERTVLSLFRRHLSVERISAAVDYKPSHKPSHTKSGKDKRRSAKARVKKI